MYMEEGRTRIPYYLCTHAKLTQKPPKLSERSRLWKLWWQEASKCFNSGSVQKILEFHFRRAGAIVFSCRSVVGAGSDSNRILVRR